MHIQTYCIDCGRDMGIVYHTTKYCKECVRKRKNKTRLRRSYEITRQRRAKKFTIPDDNLSREQQIKKISDDWYKNKVTGYLDYHYGEERWEK